MKLQVWEDFYKLPNFKPYSSVPPGFEFVEGTFRSNPSDLVEKYELTSEECGTALWNNAGMPLPDQWDDEIKQINEIQSKLSELPDHIRAVRALIASFDILHYKQNKALDTLLNAVRDQKYDHILPVGWHVPWWPPTKSKRNELLEVYISSLQAWEQKQKSLSIRTSTQYKNEILRKIYSNLGEWTSLKRSYVLLIIEKLESFNNIYTVPESFWRSHELAQYNMLTKNKLDRLIASVELESKRSRNDDLMLQRIDEYNKLVWYHAFFDEIDLWLQWIGKGKQVDFKKASQKFDEEIIQAYDEFTQALNSFLEENVPGSEKKGSGKYYHLLVSTFKDPSKEQLWLLACLWKTLREQLKIYSEGRAQALNEKSKNEWLSQL